MIKKKKKVSLGGNTVHNFYAEKLAPSINELIRIHCIIENT